MHPKREGPDPHRFDTLARARGAGARGRRSYFFTPGISFPVATSTTDPFSKLKR